MISREIRDEQENVTWQCVQAFAGTNGKAAKKAAELSKIGDQVEVVCTPSGGAQSVRLSVDENWVTSLDDEHLLRSIRALTNK